jgi:hypothetical protein
MLTLTREPPAAAPARAGKHLLSWAVELANGDRCTISTGMTAVVAGISMYYGCTSGAAGELIKSAPTWTVRYQAKGASTLEPVPVTVAWDG